MAKGLNVQFCAFYNSSVESFELVLFCQKKEELLGRKPSGTTSSMLLHTIHPYCACALVGPRANYPKENTNDQLLPK